jgi:hypothetical protein
MNLQPRLVSPVHDTFRISIKIGVCVTEIFNRGLQPKDQPMKGEVKNHITVWSFGVEDYIVARYPN